jgi:probable F420-dependent oxidoreductase
VNYYVDYPLSTEADGGAWLDPANIVAFARAAEDAGFGAISLTDHPAPSKRWLVAGGHETFDPFVGLGFVAAATSRLRLMTNLTVLPYRNPFVTAKAMTSVDVLSAGRATFVLGTGYLRSEFSALGIDYADRGAVFDEAAEVVRGVWSTDEFHHEGRFFQAHGVTMQPRPVQRPYPPLWLGGNAAVVRRRVAQWGQGWAPMVADPQVHATTGTPLIEGESDLAAKITEIKDAMKEAGRDPAALDVSLVQQVPPDIGPAEQVDRAGRLMDLGVTWLPFRVPRGPITAAIEALHAHGDEVIAKL